MKPGRVFALVAGCLLVGPGTGLLAGGGVLAAAYAFDRDDSGYFSATVDRLESPTAAITAGDLDLVTDPGSPDWLLDRLDADVRLEVTGAAARAPLFVGIGPAADVDAYLAGVAHDQVIDSTGDAPAYRRSSGQTVIAPPTEQSFWVESATGDGTQRLDWTATSGLWAAVLMNTDGSPGVAAEATVGAKAGFVLPLAMILLGLGAATTAAAVLLIVVGAAGHRPHRPLTGAGPGLGTTPARTFLPGSSTSPVTLSALLDPGLSRWQWLVKALLAIPHFVVLAFLWVAFVVLTLVAGVAILFTGSYPRGIFDFNVGVLRWSWRVEYYATTGGIGTDRYPPFSLRPEPDYPATLDVAYPDRLSNGLVLVKWLLALPHLVIVGLLIGGYPAWLDESSTPIPFDLAGGLLGLLVLVTGVVLLATGRYPRALFDLIVGLNRWIYRVIAYAALMTDRYPPFRLDQGGTEPTPAPLVPPPAGPSVADLRELDRQELAR
ncbi:MAG: hypothetical protein QOF58_4469 [Pseudonocardiales bacterium]|nr:hypothetical protein [Pseudonocardiales bacterium]